MLREVSLPGFGIGMTMDDFQIDGIRQDVLEMLKSAVRSVVNVTAEVNDFRLMSLDTNRVLVNKCVCPALKW